MLRRYQWWSLLLLNLNAIHTRSNWLCWKAQEKFQMESRFCKRIDCSYVTLLTTYPAKKTMFKVSNRNTRKRCLLISKITLKTSEWGHLTNSCFPEVAIQNHILDSFTKNIYQFAIKSQFFQFCFQVRRPVISTVVDPYMPFFEKWEIITEIFDSWKIQNISIFYFWKNSFKNGQIFQLFTSYSKERHFSITNHKVRHPNFV